MTFICGYCLKGLYSMKHMMVHEAASSALFYLTRLVQDWRYARLVGLSGSVDGSIST